MMTYIGQATFVEVIRVDPIISTTKVPNVVLGRSKWQNPTNRFDVNDDGLVNAADYQVLSNYYSAHGPGRLPLARPSTSPYVDVDGDGYLSTRDLSQLANYLQNNDPVDRAPETTHPVSDFELFRELAHPDRVRTVRNAAAICGARPLSSYSAYLRDYDTLELVEISIDAEVSNRDSVVFIRNDLIDCDTCGPGIGPGCARQACIFRLLARRFRCQLPCLNGSRIFDGTCARAEILPTRGGYTPPDCVTVTPSPEPPQPHRLERTVVICIYDESDEYYVGSFTGYTSEFIYPGTPEERYNTDKAAWDRLIAETSTTDYVNIRLGLIQPYNYNPSTQQPWGVICSGCDWPGDNNRSVIYHTLLSGPDTPSARNTKRSPRVTTDEILTMFNSLTSGNYSPTFVLFVLDNSGSIYVNDYLAQLTAAKAVIQSQFPDTLILDDKVTGRPERWLHAVTDSVSSIIARYS